MAVCRVGYRGCRIHLFLEAILMTPNEFFATVIGLVLSIALLAGFLGLMSLGIREVLGWF